MKDFVGNCVRAAVFAVALNMANTAVSAQGSADKQPETDASAQRPPKPSLARGASPKDQGVWARQIQMAYPKSAMLEEVQGSVGTKVDIDANGRVMGCVVTRSSGSAVLDMAACSGMQEYARFNPALDENGEPTGGDYRTTITYLLTPSKQPAFPRGPLPVNELQWALQIQQNYPVEALRQKAQGTVGVRVLIDAEGAPETCNVTRSSGHSSLDAAACSGMVNLATFRPALDSNGAPTRGYYSLMITYRLDPTTYRLKERGSK
ncbi:MAG: energy transducer TonB [Pseudomonadota bacterium]